jgi:hypothetical protein
MLEITATAKEKLREVLKNNSGKILRVFIQGYG